MTSPAQLAHLSRRLEDCLGDFDARESERRLLRCVLQEGWAEACAIYCGPGEGAREWRHVLSAGPADLLLDGAAVAAMRCGELPRELPLGRRVLFAGAAGRERAVVLGGSRLEEDALDQLEALLEVLCSLQTGDTSPDEPWLPPFGAA